MTDFKGQKIKVGDKVIFMLRLAGAKVDLQEGTIKAIGKSKITVEFPMDEEDEEMDTVSITSEKLYKI